MKEKLKFMITEETKYPNFHLSVNVFPLRFLTIMLFLNHKNTTTSESAHHPLLPHIYSLHVSGFRVVFHSVIKTGGEK